MPEVVAWATQHRHFGACGTDCSSKCPLCALAADFRTLLDSGSAIEPDVVKTRAVWSDNLFAHFQQQDVHEAFGTLLAACNKVDEDLALRLTDAQIRKYNSNVMLTTPAHHIFGGLQASHLRCENCGQGSRKFESFTDLSLPLLSERPFNLGSLFQHYLQWERCEYATRCESCAVAGHMQKRIDISIENLPRVLLLHLKRFAFNDGMYTMRKYMTM